MSGSVRLLWIGWTGHGVDDTAHHLLEFDGRRWRKHNPVGHVNFWKRWRSSLVAYFRRRGTRCPERDVDGSAIESDGDRFVGVSLSDLRVVDYSLSSPLFVSHLQSPAGFADLSALNLRLQSGRVEP